MGKKSEKKVVAGSSAGTVQVVLTKGEKVVPKIQIEAIDDPEFESAYGGAYVARCGNLKSDVRSTPERAQADLEQQLAARDS